MNKEAVKELITFMADNSFIIGHRNSEWTGLGPIIEEDIAFSSMAQDKIGHALALYQILHDHFGEPHPDKLAFTKVMEDFKCCAFVELPIGEYDFSLMRHFLFDSAEYRRYELLENSSFEPLAALAKRIKGELKYHTLHADSWIESLGKGNEESNKRLQAALEYALPYALGIFETGDFEEVLIGDGVFAGEKVLFDLWKNDIRKVLERSGLYLPDTGNIKPVLKGRKGIHTEYLKPMLEEMRQVYNLFPGAEW